MTTLPYEPLPITNHDARRRALTCALCGHGASLEQAKTRYGAPIVRCRDTIACERRLREAEAAKCPLSATPGPDGMRRNAGVTFWITRAAL